MLADWGFFDTEVLDGYTRLGNPLGDHPDMRRVPGIDFSSGSLGHALSAGLGMALGARGARAATSTSSCCSATASCRRARSGRRRMAAAHHSAGNLIAIVDRNRYSLDGEVDDVMGIEPLADKWRGFGWDVHRGRRPRRRGAARRCCARLRPTRTARSPALVIAHTVKGKGIAYMETEIGWHLGWLDAEDEQRGATPSCRQRMTSA